MCCIYIDKYINKIFLKNEGEVVDQVFGVF